MIQPVEAPAKARRGRGGFLKKPATTTISIEEDVLRRARKSAVKLGQSTSQWISDALQQKLDREAK